MQGKCMQKKRIILSLIAAIVLGSDLFFAGGRSDMEPSESSSAPGKEDFKIAVIVPGVVAGSTLYEELVRGARRAVGEHVHASAKVIELGFNQAEWGEKITAVAATGIYEVILSSNPSMPFVCLDIAEEFPHQKFLFVDGYIDGHPRMASFLYNQREQSYMLGYLAGLITTGGMQGAKENLKVGMIVAQEYPALTRIMIPGFLEGAQAVDSGIELDTRVIGNWYDANKAAELAKSMFDAGVDVVGVIAGGAAPGVFDAGTERNKYVLYWDGNAYAAAPGVVVGCGALMQERLVYEVVTAAIQGKVAFGRGRILSVREGYVKFITDDPHYQNALPAELRKKQQDMIDSLMAGTLVLEVPEL